MFFFVILASINCPHTQNGSHIFKNSFHKQNFTIPHAKAIEAFHRTLERMFKHKKMRNGGNATSPFISEFKIGLWPSPTAP